MMGREDKNDISDVLKRPEYLTPGQMNVVEHGINVLSEAAELTGADH
ncbi:MAG: hypothetical protein LUI39_03625 [Lachnospiraceae bacterium]|nr:hypothetical protein [Lachnospiraceae bacterium]